MELDEETVSKDGENPSSDFHFPLESEETSTKTETSNDDKIAQLNPGGTAVTPETPFIILSQVCKHS